MTNRTYTEIKELLSESENRLAHSTSYSSDNPLYDSIYALMQAVEKLNDHVHSSEYYNDSEEKLT